MTAVGYLTTIHIAVINQAADPNTGYSPGYGVGAQLFSFVWCCSSGRGMCGGHWLSVDIAAHVGGGSGGVR
jgi:hypothetical protein